MAIVMSVQDPKEGDPEYTIPFPECTRYGSDKIIYRKVFAEGLVVSKREMNGYDDSDFYATWWNPETEKFEEFMYASTRGWTYANGATIDAPQELLDRYCAHRKAVRKAHEEAKEKARRDRFETECVQLISELEHQGQVDELYDLYCSPNFRYDEILPILSKAKTSEFRLSLRFQVKSWIKADPADRDYASPLSARQQAGILKYTSRRY